MRKQKKIAKIALVGGGVSSLMILESLSKRISDLPSKPIITVFEKSASLGRGLAYRTDLKSLILNTSTDTMSVCEYDALNFQRWLQHYHGAEYNLTEVPRGVYGEYLEEKMSICLKKLTLLGCVIRKVKAEVISVFVEKKYTLNFLETCETFDMCIVATGAQVSIPDNIEGSIKKKLLNIFDEEKISSIKKFSRIVILGSGQSAIDACIMLESYNRQGYYTLISRSGVLPRVKSNFVGDSFKGAVYGLDVRNYNLSALCNKMLNSIKWKVSHSGLMKLTPASFRSMQVDLKRASKKLPSWQKNMIEITPFINELWSLRTECEKQDFTKKWQKNLYFLRSAIMPKSAIRFLEIYNSGRVDMVWGEYKITLINDMIQVSSNNTVLNFDYVINTTGIKAYSHLGVFQEAIRSGAVAINSQDGFNIDFQSMRILDSCGNINCGLYSIGYPTQGSVLVANSVELLRQKAVKIANNIYENLSKENYENHLYRH